MTLIARLSSALLILLMLAGCGASNVPSFVAGESLQRIEVTNDQTGHKGVASKDNDNLNELLNLLHLGDITADSRSDAPVPTTSVYTVVAYDQSQSLWTVFVPDNPQSNRIYFSDAVHPDNSGIYSLKQPIQTADLDQFVQKYPAS